MDKKQKMKGLFSSRRMKYGSIATVLTALFIAAVILVNAIVSAVDSKWSLYFDLTKDKFFTISEETKTMVDETFSDYKKNFGEDPKIKVTFLRARDTILEDEMKAWVVTLVESYAEEYSEITVEFKEDLTTHPENYENYTRLGHELNHDSIIITNSLVKDSFRILTFDSCLVYDENGQEVWAFQGEMKLNAALLKLTSKKSPVVQFTAGHGESKPEALWEILTNCGFTVKEVDLSKEEIDKDCKMLIMSNPTKDITYSENDSVVTEYTKISEYLNSYRSMVVIATPTTPELPVLDELLADWGMKLVRNQVVMDDVACHTQDNKALYVDYAETETVAAALTQSLTSLSSPPRTIMIDAAPIEILKTGDGETGIVESVLNSSDHAYTEEITAEGTKKSNGPFSLMAISTRYTIVDNVDTYGHLLLIGSENFTETNAFREQFGNTDIIYSMIRLLSDEDIYMKTHYKLLEDYTIDMQSGTVYVYGVITAVLIPLLIFALGTVVYIRRKHR